ncbi:Coiled-coil domain-containing protein 96 [Nibea albiflora]|uniref:Coiled-coil domain-containing protein 96 n=1 Tax=Nibea albiflora TaxID=240163 RepID=A0ACB7EVP6_NIBAL|nr:Coiled-coil domain-containing protein 96 [Nibea albiflora]
MDREAEHEENEVRNDTEREVSAEFSSEEDIAPAAVNGHEGVPAEAGASDQDGETSESMKATEEALAEEAPSSEPEENSVKELPAVTTSPDLDVEMNEVNEQPPSHEESVVFEMNSNDDDGPPSLHLETPERENTSPTQEQEDEAEGEEPTTAAAAAAAAPPDKEDVSYKEHMRLLQELREERDKASQRSSQLQTKLAEYFRKRARDDVQLERDLPVSERLREYERHMSILSDLKLQITTESEAAQQQEEELSFQAKEKLDKVENEWQALVALKQDVAVTVLSRRLGKQAAQAKVESTLAAEQLCHDQLIKLRLKHIKLRIKIHRLEAELRDGEEHARDPLQLQFEQLQAERLEMKKHAEKQSEESLKMQKKISSSLEAGSSIHRHRLQTEFCSSLLSNIKEKLFWCQMDVHAKQEQLAAVDATVARKRDLLTRTKQARNSLQRDNLRLKERRGLLGNRVLLRDFEDTVDASDHLEEQLENLKGRQAEIVFSCSRWRKTLGTT